MNKERVQLEHFFDSALKREIQALPSKLSFKIGEVADLLGIKTHVLRYWEQEFSSLKPTKLNNGQRIYFRSDVEMALMIKKLLYRDGYSLRGAKKAILPFHKENRKRQAEESKKQKAKHKLQTCLDQISSLKKAIDNPFI